VADCVAAQIARERAVERGTHEKQDRVWRRWKEYTRSIGIKEDLFLENFSRDHRHIIIGAFAMAVRESSFSRASHERLAAGTVKDTVQHVCATFRENGYPNPSIDDNGLPAFILQREFRSLKIPNQKKSIKKQYPSQSSVSSSTKTAQILNKPRFPHLNCHSDWTP